MLYLKRTHRKGVKSSEEPLVITCTPLTRFLIGVESRELSMDDMTAELEVSVIILNKDF